MVDNLNNTDTGTAMQAHKPVDDGWNSPIDDEGAGRQIQGTLLRYDDKQWFTGKEKTVIPNGTRLIVWISRRGGSAGGMERLSSS